MQAAMIKVSAVYRINKTEICCQTRVHETAWWTTILSFVIIITAWKLGNCKYKSKQRDANQTFDIITNYMEFHCESIAVNF